MNTNQLNQILDILDEAIAGTDYCLIDIEWVQYDKILRVFVDHKKGGPVLIEHCVEVTRLVKDIEEIDAIVPGATYRMEISSPGIERPLRRAEHFSVAMENGQNIDVKLNDKVDGRKNILGTVSAVDDDIISMNTDLGDISFPLKLLKKARVVFDWNQQN